MLFTLFCYYFVLYVEKKMDKTWMTKSRGTREYRDGCRLFVGFAVSNCRIPNGNIHCPVSRVKIINATRSVLYLPT
jgi:hypothetical protein